MIIVDVSGVAIAALFSQDAPEELSEDLLRHMVLNIIRKHNLAYRKKFGRMVIACDNHSWRRSVFPEYKAARKAAKEESDIDWDTFWTSINKVRDELKELFPYPVINVEGAEADDIIGHLTRITADPEFGRAPEPVMIVSGDKDFYQLHRFNGVEQYSPQRKSKVKPDCPVEYLYEHIMKGDAGDGVPNVLSPDDIFITEGTRQTPMTKVKLAQWRQPFREDKLKDVMPAHVYRNFCRNRQMVDLDSTPEYIIEEIDKQMEEQSGKGNGRILNYLIQKRCRNLVSCAQEFFVTNN